MHHFRNLHYVVLESFPAQVCACTMLLQRKIQSKMLGVSSTGTECRTLYGTHHEGMPLLKREKSVSQTLKQPLHLVSRSELRQTPCVMFVQNFVNWPTSSKFKREGGTQVHTWIEW